MKMRIFSLLILLSLTIGLAVQTSRVSAEGANRVEFTATAVSDCSSDPTWCSFGELRTLPNGKAFVTGWKLINVFTASDPRWNANCYFTGDPFPPGGGAFPVSGSFICYPRDPQYAGGWWEGSVNHVFMPDKVLGVWHAKGYGTLDRLQVNVYQTNPHWYGDVPPDVNNVGVITELSGYQP
jgi:hypothetical protein